MAGIGFRLQKLFQEDYFSSRIKAYAFAGLVTAGPWLIVIATIALIQWLTAQFTALGQEERELFNISVAYCFIFSQVIFGLQQLVVTRYIADLIYERKLSDVFPAFIGMSKVTLLLALVTWGIFVSFSALPFLYEVLILALYVTINMIWVLFLFLSAAKNYQAVAYSFLVGGVIAVVAVVGLGMNIERFVIPPHTSSFMLLLGFTFGMVVTMFGLLLSMLITFGERKTSGQFSYFHYFDRFPSLFWTGFLYNTGVWVCNWTIWFGEGRSILIDTFVYHRIYDTAIFWSYLTIVPALIIFVVSVETRFYDRYRVFYGNVNYGGTLDQIKRSKAKMQRVLKQEMERLVRSQGVFSLLVILSIGFVGEFFNLQPILISIFRFTTIGAFANAMVLVITLILLYFEDRRGAMYTSICFFTANLVLSIALLPLGFDGYGLSFSIGSTIAFLFAVIRLITFIEKVDYHAFCQPNETRVKKPRTFFTRTGQLLNRQKAS
ncbi:exopolysaccharide Pel transporter PelG [Halobacillus salinus]|uniref:exopolysaccharide Pel transporter PelG n=1 Tax=Halobacillus salinus TaxID=192814 RepID=UPI0009A69B07|nr:exopolysaccharide Pel transporter PelG [Halobacillus salinus]